MGTMASQEQIKQQISASLALMREIHQWPVNSPHKLPVTRKMFPFDDVIMIMRSYDCTRGREVDLELILLTCLHLIPRIDK